MKLAVEVKTNASPKARERGPQALGGCNNSEKKTQRMINVIFEGKLVGQNRSYSHKVMSTSQTKQSRKRTYLEEPITFSEEDLDSIIKAHEVPLIIKEDIMKIVGSGRLW